MTYHQELQARDLAHIWHPASQMKDYEEFQPIVIKYAKGSYLYDYDEKPYLDVVSSWWCNLLGHCNREISDAVKKQLDTLEHVIFSNFSHEGVIRLCEELIKVVPAGLEKFNFSDNGSSSVECALKLAFQYQNQIGKPHRTKFMCLSEGYHGETIGALSVGAIDLYSQMYKPMLMDAIQVPAPDCYHCPYGEHRHQCSCPCAEQAEKAFARHGEETCAIILEPLVQGAAGMRIYPPLFLQKIRALCDKYEVVMIVDEIATGFGRTGKYFACDHARISPDIMTVSKGLTGGYMPFSITLTTNRIYDAFYDDYNKHHAFMHSHTYSGNPLGTSAALAVLNILQRDQIIEKSNAMAEYFHNKLQRELGSHKNVGEIRHINLINAIEIVKDPAKKEHFDPSLRLGYQIYRRAIEKGLLLRPLGDILYFNPPLTISQEECDLAVALCKESMEEIIPQYTR